MLKYRSLRLKSQTIPHYHVLQSLEHRLLLSVSPYVCTHHHQADTSATEIAITDAITNVTAQASSTVDAIPTTDTFNYDLAPAISLDVDPFHALAVSPDVTETFTADATVSDAPVALDVQVSSDGTLETPDQINSSMVDTGTLSTDYAPIADISSDPTAIANDPTAVPVAGATVPAAPTNVRITGFNSSMISIGWNAVTNETGYRVERSTDGINFSAIATCSATATSYSNMGLATGTTYYYRVFATNSVGSSPSSNVVNATTTGTSTTSGGTQSVVAPGNLHIVGVSTSSISIGWNDVANETGYRVERSTDGVNFSFLTNVAANVTSYLNTGLTSNTLYYYRVLAFDTTDMSTPSNIASIKTTALTTVPTAPSSLTASVSGATVSLHWTDNATNETSNIVERSTDGGTTFVTYATLGASVVSYADSVTTAGSTYVYRVKAANSAGYSGYSNTASATLAPATPTGLAASNITTSQITVTWSNVGGETAFKVYRSTDGTTFSVIATLGSNVLTYTNTGLNASTKYYYKIGASNAGGETDSAAIAATTSVPVVTLPAAPTGLSTTVSGTTITLHWTDNATNETSNIVERSTDGGTTFVTYATLGASVVSYADSVTTAGSTYVYRVYAVNSAGSSGYSNTASGTVAPAAPTGLAASNVTTSQITLAWGNVGGETAFKVYRSTDGTTFSVIATLGTNVLTYTNTGLNASTKYYYKVGASNAGGEADSAAIAATTSAAVSSGVTFATKNMTSFTELVITGSTAADTISLSQSGGTLTVVANGQTTTYSMTLGDIKLYGGGGNDILTVNSSVNIATLIYGGDGSDTIKALGSAKMTIVTIGSGTNTVTGNGINTSYWVNTGDIVNASTTEIANGAVNRVASFYQPFTTSSVPLTLYGQNLADPTDSGTTIRLTNSSFFGTGPTMNDVNQHTISDCYFLADLSSLADTEPSKLVNLAVDLGDGTYAFRFIRSGVTSFVRVDGDLAAGSNAYGLKNSTPGANGNQWGSLFEKAYAFFRTGADTYSSLNIGSPTSVFNDLGVSSSWGYISGFSATSLETTINNALSAGKPVTALTLGSISGGAPLVASHVYTILGTYRDSSGNLMIRMRNPWGTDGFNDDSAPSDGIVTISWAVFAANMNTLTWGV